MKRQKMFEQWNPTWKLMLILTLALVTLNTLDVSTTVLGLSTGKLFELNPYFLVSFSLVFFKFLLCFAFLPIYWVTKKYTIEIFTWLPFSASLFCCCSYVPVVLSNIINYLKVLP